MSEITGTRALVGWLSHRAWSRAGAVAEVLGTGPTRRALALTTRVALFLAGAATIAGSVALMLWNQLGPGPLDVFIGAVRARTGLPLAPAVWLTVGSLIAIAWSMGRRPGPGTILSPLLIGSLMQLFLERLELVTVPDQMLARSIIQLAAIAGMGLGAGALIVSGLGAGTGELLAAAASDRSGQPEPRVRIAFETSWLVLGAALGGPIGYGTVAVAALIGPSVAVGYRFVDHSASHVRRQIASTRAVIAPA